MSAADAPVVTRGLLEGGLSALGSTAVVSICLSACNHEYLADWLRLLRGRANGGWLGPVVIVADEKNAAAIGKFDRTASIALVSDSQLPQIAVSKRPPSSTKSAGLTAAHLEPMLQHMAAAMMKTRVLDLPELSGFKMLLYLDIDLWPLHSTGRWIEAKMRNVSDIGMAGDTSNAFCTNAILLRRTSRTAACLVEWRGEMQSNLRLVREATSRGQMTACGGRRPRTLSTHPCFKDQHALDRALHRPQGGACARAITSLPVPVLRWQSSFEVQQVALRTLLQEPSAEMQFLEWAAEMQIRERPAATSKDSWEERLAKGGRRAHLPFVHFDRYERTVAAVQGVDGSREGLTSVFGSLDQAAAAAKAAEERKHSSTLNISTSGVQAAWLRSDLDTRRVHRLSNPSRGLGCAGFNSSIYLVNNKHATAAERLELFRGPDCAADGCGLPMLGRPDVPARAWVTARSHEMRRPSAGHADLQRAHSVLLGALDASAADARSDAEPATHEIWTMCGLSHRRAQGLPNVLVTSLPSMRTRLGPQLPTEDAGLPLMEAHPNRWGERCAALAIHADGSGAPALPCAMRSGLGLLCYDRRALAWRRPLREPMPLPYSHATVVVVPPGACAAGRRGHVPGHVPGHEHVPGHVPEHVPGHAHGHILVLNLQGVGPAHEREVWAYDLDPDGRPDSTGRWRVLSNDTSPSDTARPRTDSAVVESASGRFLFSMGGRYVDESAAPAPLARYIRTDSGALAYSLIPRSSKPPHRQIIATSEVRALDVCGAGRWVAVGAMQRPRTGHAACVAAVGGSQYAVVCGGTSPRFWPPVVRPGAGPGGGPDKQAIDTCEMNLLSQLEEIPSSPNSSWALSPKN
jgi:hypothetical protein